MPETCQSVETRTFEFARDTFAFENETFWTYSFDDAGKMGFVPRNPKPTYGHRCFVLTRAARQFFFHARFDPGQKPPDDDACLRLIRQIVARSPRQPCPAENQIVVPGYASLREFSAARAALLKAECGGAWRSYVLRSHWRMVFPISRAHQARTAESLLDSLKRHVPPIIHIVNFPSLSINHSLLLFSATETNGRIEFQASDPNDAKRPSDLSFDRATQTFSFPKNAYWQGGTLNVIEIYRTWWM
jgi:hypothetical protein